VETSNLILTLESQMSDRPFTREAKRSLISETKEATIPQLRGHLFLANRGLPEWIVDLVSNIAAQVEDDVLKEQMTEIVESLPCNEDMIHFDLVKYGFIDWCINSPENGLLAFSKENESLCFAASYFCALAKGCRALASDQDRLKSFNFSERAFGWAEFQRLAHWNMEAPSGLDIANSISSFVSSEQMRELARLLQEYLRAINIVALGVYSQAERCPELDRIYENLCYSQCGGMS
jgi:hypothetical protein